VAKLVKDFYKFFDRLWMKDIFAGKRSYLRA
jgi:hypothetical protein